MPLAHERHDLTDLLQVACLEFNAEGSLLATGGLDGERAHPQLVGEEDLVLSRPAFNVSMTHFLLNSANA